MHLEKNQITGIKSLENVNWNNLKILDLFDNQITDVNVFKNKFDNLEDLDLSFNKIISFDIFDKRVIKKLNKNNNEVDNVENIVNNDYNGDKKFD